MPSYNDYLDYSPEESYNVPSNTGQLGKILKVLGGFGGNALSLLSGIGIPIAQMFLANKHNKMNIDQQKENNKLQMQLTRETNAMQMMESEKAYQRSLPTNQVANMMTAGMSRAGALNALSGGGSYTPASINTAQTDAVQSDPSGMLDALAQLSSNAIQMRQHKQEMDLAREQMQAQKEISDKNNETALRTAVINADAHRYSSDNALKGTIFSSNNSLEGTRYSADMSYKAVQDRIAEDKRQYDDMSPYQKSLYVAQVAQAENQADLLAKQARGQFFENSKLSSEWKLMVDNWEIIKSQYTNTQQAEKALQEMNRAYYEMMVKYYGTDKALFDVKWGKEVQLAMDLVGTASQFYIGNKVAKAAGSAKPLLQSTMTASPKGITTTSYNYQ